MSDIEHGADFTKDDPERAKVHRRVSNRLRLARALIEMREPLAVPNDVGPDNAGDWHGEFHLHDSLIYYLLLTCFDLLGQNPQWADFHRWLNDRKKKPERLAAAERVPKELTDPVKIARHLHGSYNEMYGVRGGFNHFIDGVLSADARSTLLGSIGMIHLDTIQAEGDKAKQAELLAEAKANEPALKKKFLFQLRNDFTHTVLTFNTATRNEAGDRLVIVDSARPRKRFVQHVTGVDKMYFVADWPFVLYEVVASAIGEAVPDFNVTFAIMVQGEWGVVELKDAKLPEVRDADRLAALVDEVIAEMKRDS